MKKNRANLYAGGQTPCLTLFPPCSAVLWRLQGSNTRGLCLGFVVDRLGHIASSSSPGDITILPHFAPPVRAVVYVGCLFWASHNAFRVLCVREGRGKRLVWDFYGGHSRLERESPIIDASILIYEKQYSSAKHFKKTKKQRHQMVQSHTA